MKPKIFPLEKGFTFIELLAVFGIITTILTFAVINLRQAQNQTSINTEVTVVAGDIKSQQMKAMSGYTDGSSTSTYHGIYFDSQRYVLFQGNTYQEGAATNFSLPLDENFRFESITFPASQLVFIPPSGEVYNFSEASNTVTLRNINDNEIRVFTINQLGVLTAIE